MEWKADAQPEFRVHGGLQTKGFDYSVVNKDRTSDHYFWTTDPPNVDGWYWACTDAGDPCMVKVGLFGTGKSLTLWCYMTGSLKAHDLDVFDYWLGPLPKPELPNE